MNLLIQVLVVLGHHRLLLLLLFSDLILLLSRLVDTPFLRLKPLEFSWGHMRCRLTSHLQGVVLWLFLDTHWDISKTIEFHIFSVCHDKHWFFIEWSLIFPYDLRWVAVVQCWLFLFILPKLSYLWECTWIVENMEYFRWNLILSRISSDGSCWLFSCIWLTRDVDSFFFDPLISVYLFLLFRSSRKVLLFCFGLD